LLNWVQQGGFEHVKTHLQDYLTPIVGVQALPPKRKMREITVEHRDSEAPKWELNLPINATLAEVKAAINANTDVNVDELTDFKYIVSGEDYPLTQILPERAERITFQNKEYNIPVQYKGQIFNVGVDYDMDVDLFNTRISEDLNLPNPKWIHVFMGLKELGNSNDKILDVWRANPGVPITVEDALMHTITLIGPDRKEVAVQVPLNASVDDLEYLAVFKLGIPAEQRPRIRDPEGLWLAPYNPIPAGMTVFYVTV
jgi:hypothetical protein